MLIWFHVLLIKKNLGIAAKSALKFNEELESNWYRAGNSSSNKVKQASHYVFLICHCFATITVILPPSKHEPMSPESDILKSVPALKEVHKL